LAPLPSSSKISNIVYNDKGKFYCFFLAKKDEPPIMHIYDLQELCPKLDRYWMYEYLKNFNEMKKNNNTMDIFVDRGSRKRGEN
jgi:hypothetical protein